MNHHVRPTLFLCILFLTTMLSCRKDSPEPGIPPTPGPSTSIEPVVLKPNVVVCDSNILHLDWNEAELDLGNFVFTVNGTAPTIEVGDIIVGVQEEGFLRQVDAISLSGNTLTLQTSDASLEEAIESGGFTFANDLTDLEERSLGFEYAMDNYSLVQQGPLNVTIDHADLSLVSNWNLSADYGLLTGLRYFDLSTTDAQVNGNITLHIVASQAANLATVDNTVARFQRTILILSGGLPVVITVYINLKTQFGAQIDAAFDQTVMFDLQSVSDLGINFNNNTWTSTNNMENTGSVHSTSGTGQAGVTVNLALVPEVSFKLYRVVGPYFQPSLQETVGAQISSPDLNWDFKADAWLRAVLGVRAGIFSRTWANYEHAPWDTDHLFYRTPYRMERISEGSQTGNGDETLNDPIKVRIVDSNGSPQSNVPVFFAVTTGGGNCTPNSMLTDADGYAQCLWTLGPNQAAIQYLSASAKFGDNSYINSAPLEFGATTSPCGVIVDVDGNSYNTVQIGNQCWMAENLRTSRYSDGSLIVSLPDSGQWVSTLDGACCSYLNQSSNDIIYGKLYNGYAAIDTRNICPLQWHVPTLSEWTVLALELGGEAIAGGKLKEVGTLNWQFPNVGATNESGFTGKPTPVRELNYGYNFQYQTSVAFWWSSEFPVPGSYGQVRQLYSASTALIGFSQDRVAGLCIRCLHD